MIKRVKATRATEHKSATEKEKNTEDKGAVNVEFARWMIVSRAKNQETAVQLHTVITYLCQGKPSKANTETAEGLLAATFALWRAAFLADTDGSLSRKKRLQHAREFFQQVIMTNAIGFPQDRSSRFWTFRFYARSAHDHLRREPIIGWPGVREALDEDVDDDTPRQRRWTRLQSALEIAVRHFAQSLHLDL